MVQLKAPNKQSLVKGATVAGLVFLSLVLLALSVSHYNNFKQKELSAQVAKEQAVVARQNEEKAAQQARFDKLMTQYSKAALECQKGASYGNLLTNAQTRTIKPENRPVCPTGVPQL